MAKASAGVWLGVVFSSRWKVINDSKLLRDGGRDGLCEVGWYRWEYWRMTRMKGCRGDAVTKVRGKQNSSRLIEGDVAEVT